MTTKVKTIYESKYRREPDIEEYDTRNEAEFMVASTLKWGLGVVSCEIMEGRVI